MSLYARNAIHTSTSIDSHLYCKTAQDVRQTSIDKHVSNFAHTSFPNATSLTTLRDMRSPQGKEPYACRSIATPNARFTGAWEEYPVRNPLPEDIRIASARNSHCPESMHRARDRVRPLNDIHFPGICHLRACLVHPARQLPSRPT